MSRSDAERLRDILDSIDAIGRSARAMTVSDSSCTACWSARPAVEAGASVCVPTLSWRRWRHATDIRICR